MVIIIIIIIAIAIIHYYNLIILDDLKIRELSHSYLNKFFVNLRFDIWYINSNCMASFFYAFVNYLCK